MCHTKKQIFTVCAHASLVIVECPDVAFARDESNRWACVRPPCQHTQAIEPVYGFCPTCASFYVPGPSPLRSERVVRSYWAYKATRKWQKAVDAPLVPGRAVFGGEEGVEEDGASLPAAPLTPASPRYNPSRQQRRRSSSFVGGQTCEELAMAHAIGWEGEFSETCKPCRTAKRRDTARWARRAREATLDWARTGDAHALPREQCVAPKWLSPAPSLDRSGGRPPTPAPSFSSISRRSSKSMERAERDLRAQISAFPLSRRTSRDSSVQKACRPIEGRGSVRSQFSFPELVPSPLRATSLTRVGTSDPKADTIQRPQLEIRRFAPPRGPRLAKCRIHSQHGDAAAPDCRDCIGRGGDGIERVVLNEVAIPPAWI